MTTNNTTATVPVFNSEPRIQILGQGRMANQKVGVLSILEYTYPNWRETGLPSFRPEKIVTRDGWVRWWATHLEPETGRITRMWLERRATWPERFRRWWEGGDQQ